MTELSTTVFWPGHGFYAKLGPMLEDWEPVSIPEDFGIDQYEIDQIAYRANN